MPQLSFMSSSPVMSLSPHSSTSPSFPHSSTSPSLSPHPAVIQIPYDSEHLDGDAGGVLLDSNEGHPTDSFEAIVIHRPSASSPAPGLLVPHGGPHGAFTTGFVLYYAFMAALGYHVVLVNFRGSTGFGEKCVQWLPGKDEEGGNSTLGMGLEHALWSPPDVGISALRF